MRKSRKKGDVGDVGLDRQPGHKQMLVYISYLYDGTGLHLVTSVVELSRAQDAQLRGLTGSWNHVYNGENQLYSFLHVWSVLDRGSGLKVL